MDANNKPSDCAILPTTNYGSANEDGVWRFTGHWPSRGTFRDGSRHATDEVFNGASHMAATMMSILRNGIARERKFGAGSSLEDCLFQHLWKFFNLPLCLSTLHHSISGSEELESFSKCWIISQSTHLLQELLLLFV
jgi:hypothetical protein